MRASKRVMHTSSVIEASNAAGVISSRQRELRWLDQAYARLPWLVDGRCQSPGQAQCLHRRDGPQHLARKEESVLWQARLPESLFEPGEKFVLDRKGRQTVDADARQQFTEFADAPLGLLVS